MVILLTEIPQGVLLCLIQCGSSIIEIWFKPSRAIIHCDEGLTLETSVFESFTVANLPYRLCG